MEEQSNPERLFGKSRKLQEWPRTWRKVGGHRIYFGGSLTDGLLWSRKKGDMSRLLLGFLHQGG